MTVGHCVFGSKLPTRRSSRRPTVPLASSRRLGLVLGGGGARGAYQAGVLSYLFNHVARDLPRPPRLDVICGTSVGAVNACALAAFADDLGRGADGLVAAWRGLSLREVLRLDRRRVFAMMRALLGRPPRQAPTDMQRGGLLDTTPLEALIAQAIPFPRISERLRAGDLSAVAVSATHLDSGSATVFVEAAHGERTLRESRTRIVPASIGSAHVLASAAIPLLFPAVSVDGALYCDGALRHNVPLAPAIHLGCDALLIISPRFTRPGDAAAAETAGFFPGPLFLLGKMLNALILDRIDEDLDRLRQLNALATTVGVAAATIPGLRRIDVLEISSSVDLGAVAADHVRSPAFRRRRGGVTGKILSRMARGESPTDADLLSYMLFDGGYAAELVRLGWEDARRRADDAAAFLTRAATAA